MKVQEAVLDLIEPKGMLLLDMSQVSYMSSAGLRVLLGVYRRVSDGQGRAVLVGISEEIAETMSMTGFLDYFATAADVEEAILALRG